jgi:hypothetical protein
MIDHCCYTFERLVENRDMLGLSIEVPNSHSGVYRIVMRSIDSQFEEQFIEELKKNNIKFNFRVSEMQGISFCPWCGKSLV